MGVRFESFGSVIQAVSRWFPLASVIPRLSIITVGVAIYAECATVLWATGELVVAISDYATIMATWA